MMLHSGLSGHVLTQRQARPDRAFFAVEPAVLQRAISDALGGEAPPSAAADLPVVARLLAAYGHTKDSDEARGPAAVDRLVQDLADELWFLGVAPSATVQDVFVPLGADRHDAAALLNGGPLTRRLDRPQAPLAARAFPPSISALDPSLAPAWRAMLREVVECYQAADEALAATVAANLGVAPGPASDRVVYGVLASLHSVVDFAADGHEILVGRVE